MADIRYSHIVEFNAVVHINRDRHFRVYEITLLAIVRLLNLMLFYTQEEHIMSDSNIGGLAWIDLTVANASEVKGFYQQVVGWQVEDVAMGDYNDYSMNNPENNEPVTGICHAKGVNADLPASWLPYFLVADIDKSAQQVLAQGGELLTEIKSMSGEDRYVVIKDPAGAVCALYCKM